jgi:hypothetical protein
MDYGLTEQQKKWFASVREGIERDTGRTLDQWVAIVKKSSETTRSGRVRWLKAKYDVGINRAAAILDAAFPEEGGWDTPEAMVEALWRDKDQRKIHDALVAAVSKFDGALVGERKTFTAFSRKAQFAAARPTKEGVRLGLAVDPRSSPRLSQPKKNEGWSDRNKAVVVLNSPKDIDADLKKLLKVAFDAP